MLRLGASSMVWSNTSILMAAPSMAGLFARVPRRQGKDRSSNLRVTGGFQGRRGLSPVCRGYREPAHL
jgi:hypothetical protein